MPAVQKSRYETARALEGLSPRAIVPGAVRFTGHGYALGWLKREGKPPIRIIRITVDAGQAIEIALDQTLALSLGQDLLTRETGAPPVARRLSDVRPSMGPRGCRQETSARADKAMELFRAGVHIIEIAKKIGYSHASSVRNLLLKYHRADYTALMEARQATQDEWLPQAWEDYLAGASLEAIAHKYGLSCGTQIRSRFLAAHGDAYRSAARSRRYNRKGTL